MVVVLLLLLMLLLLLCCSALVVLVIVVPIVVFDIITVVALVMVGAAASYIVPACYSHFDDGVVTNSNQMHEKTVGAAGVDEVRSGVIEMLTPEDMADQVVHILSAPPRMAIHELIARPTLQQF